MSEVLFVVTSKAEIPIPKLVQDTAPSDFLGDKLAGGFHMTEMGVVYDRLKSEGHDISFVSPEGGPVVPYKFDPANALHKKLKADTTLQQQLSNTLRPEAVDYREHSGILYIGGLAAMWGVPDSEELQSLTRVMYETGRVVAAVCHGPAGLVNVKLSNGQPLVKDRKLTSLTNKEEARGSRDLVVPFSLESELRWQGADFTSAAPWEECVVVDEVAVRGIDRVLITGQNPASTPALARVLSKIL